MKIIQTVILAVIVLILPSCNGQLDENQAREVVESLLKQIDNENYDGLDEFYTGSFNSGESDEVRAEKFTKLRNILGSIKSMEVIDSEHIAEFGEPAKINLTYRIERTKVSSIEKFVVVKEEGDYKVAAHGITNE